MDNSETNKGKIVQVIGAVVDAEFPRVPPQKSMMLLKFLINYQIRMKTHD